MAMPGFSMSTQQRIPSHSINPDDPFVTTEKLFSTPERLHNHHTMSTEDAKRSQTAAANANIFGNAPLYPRPSSAIRLPSSPTSRRSPVVHKLLDQPSYPLRASNIFLNAGAAPFQPKATSPVSQESPKRSISYPHQFKDLFKGIPMFSDVKRSREQGNTGMKQLYQANSTPEEFFLAQAEQIQLAEQACSNLSPPLPPPLDRTLYSTPMRHRSLSQDIRRLAYSDDPSICQFPIGPRHASSPSPRCNTWTNKSGLGLYQRYEPLPGGYHLQTQHLHRSWSIRSPIKSLDQTTDTFLIDGSNSAHRDQENVDKLLNRVDQGPFLGDQSNGTSQSTIFDPYTSTPSVAPQANTTSQNQINPYSQDGSTISTGAYFPGSTNYPQQVIQS